VAVVASLAGCKASSRSSARPAFCFGSVI